MSNRAVSEEVARIRNAFAAGEYARGQRLWEEYASALGDSIRQGKAGEEALSEARELVDWARLVVLAFRSHAASQRSRARVAAAYGRRPDRSARSSAPATKQN